MDQAPDSLQSESSLGELEVWVEKEGYINAVVLRIREKAASWRPKRTLREVYCWFGVVLVGIWGGVRRAVIRGGMDSIWRALLSEAEEEEGDPEEVMTL